MDDYLQGLLAKQTFPEEQKPEELTKLLEQQGSLREESTGKDTGEQVKDPEGAWLLEEMDGSAVGRRTEGAQSAENAPEIGEAERESALEETANRRFLEELEREITSLSYGSTAAVVIHQIGETDGEPSSDRTQYTVVERQMGSRSLSPEGLSRVFERDARRYP